MTPGDYATLTEEMEHLGTQDYMGAKSWRGINDDDDENHYPFPLVRLPSFPSSFFLSSLTPSSTLPSLHPRSFRSHPPYITLLASLVD
jgi:glycogen(starch) synthase